MVPPTFAFVVVVGPNRDKNRNNFLKAVCLWSVCRGRLAEAVLTWIGLKWDGSASHPYPFLAGRASSRGCGTTHFRIPKGWQDVSVGIIHGRQDDPMLSSAGNLPDRIDDVERVSQRKPAETGIAPRR